MSKPLHEAGRYWGQYIGVEMIQSMAGNPGISIRFNLTHIWRWVSKGIPGQEDVGNYNNSIEPFELAVRYYYTSDSMNQEIFERKMDTLGFNGDYDNPQFGREEQWLKENGGEELILTWDDWKKGKRESLDIMICAMGGKAKSMSDAQKTQMNAIWAQRKANQAVTNP